MGCSRGVTCAQLRRAQTSRGTRQQGGAQVECGPGLHDRPRRSAAAAAASGGAAQIHSVRARVVTAQVSLQFELLAAGGNAASMRPVRAAHPLTLLVRSGAGAFPLEIDVVYARRHLFGDREKTV